MSRGVQAKLRGGVDLECALYVARRFGCDIRPVRRTGEIRIRHPACARPLRINNRRADAPRKLVTFVNAIIRRSGNTVVVC